MLQSMADRISVQQVAHVARLSRLHLTGEELERFAGQLGAVLDHAADLAALDLDGVQPMSHPLPLVNVLRDDVPRPGLSPEEALAAAPEVSDGRFAVPSILAESP